MRLKDQNAFIATLYKRTKKMNDAERKYTSILLECLNELYDFDAEGRSSILDSELNHVIQDFEALIDYTTSVLEKGSYHGS